MSLEICFLFSCLDPLNRSFLILFSSVRFSNVSAVVLKHTVAGPAPHRAACCECAAGPVAVLFPAARAGQGGGAQFHPGHPDLPAQSQI